MNMMVPNLPLEVHHLPVLIIHMLGVRMAQVRHLGPGLETYLGIGDLESEHAIAVGCADNGPDEMTRREYIGVYMRGRRGRFSLGRSCGRGSDQANQTKKTAYSRTDTHVPYLTEMRTEVHLFPFSFCSQGEGILQY